MERVSILIFKKYYLPSGVGNKQRVWGVWGVWGETTIREVELTVWEFNFPIYAVEAKIGEREKIFIRSIVPH